MELKKLLITEKQNLVDLVDYQKDSVVSKTLVNKPAGTITLFAFDEGQSLSEHTAPFDALVYVMDGEGEVIIDGKSNQLLAGEIILMPANVPHAVKALQKFKMMLIMVKS
ncbi:MAG TPA: cupin domain-containing protein [Syntrophomonadaceae bacterium]|nr:cupin domain-containing protein [Syntrophomonadaceae bacterium]HRX21589.1 cupin domain-containing protein [Syntrophomonadaceae bacterium]